MPKVLVFGVQFVYPFVYQTSDFGKVFLKLTAQYLGMVVMQDILASFVEYLMQE
ncbi:MAG: hypothetical protein IK084_05100 [Bacteroidaceae bacterium]|nr:hypothetical protein [Bacteroidaceae bacterium]